MTDLTTTDPAEMARLLRLPAEERPAWLNNFLGDMTIPPISDTSTNPLLDVCMANNTPTNCTLRFPLDEVLAVAEHANTAPRHTLNVEETEARPRLWWCKDDGTYLRSNGRYPADNNDSRPPVVFATGWGKGTDPTSILGGGDFHESIELTTPLPGDGSTLLDNLRTAAADGATHFHLTIADDGDHQTLTYTTK